mmetsp:Transcript_17160/g.36865  ORF Transcript_17160/g.36865 Transcript_17160/m.36865 type:complete len:255 (-) Transcript_17160:2146-2910(-)
MAALATLQDRSRQVRVAQNAASRTRGHPAGAGDVGKPLQEIDDEKATDVEEPDECDVLPLDRGLDDLEGVAKPSQDRHQNVSEQDGHCEREGGPAFREETRHQQSGSTAREDQKLDSDGHLKVNGGIFVILRISSARSGEPVGLQFVESHRLHRLEDAIKKGSNHDRRHRGNLGECRGKGVVICHWQHRHIVQEGQKDDVQGGHRVIVGVDHNGEDADNLDGGRDSVEHVGTEPGEDASRLDDRVVDDGKTGRG